MKRSERISWLTKVLLDNPQTVFSLRQFSDGTQASKTSLSEDIDIIKRTFQKYRLGVIETIVGAGGGVRYCPQKDPAELIASLENILAKLRCPERMILTEYLAYGDILFHPQTLHDLALAVLGLFPQARPDGVLTIETTGLAIGLEVARLSGAPLIVARKDNLPSQGITLSTHYKSRSHQTIQTMYITKGAIVPDSRILVVDDFMRGGGTITGLRRLVWENDAHLIGSCVFMQDISHRSTLADHHHLFTIEKTDDNLRIELGSELWRQLDPG